MNPVQNPATQPVGGTISPQPLPETPNLSNPWKMPLIIFGIAVLVLVVMWTLLFIFKSPYTSQKLNPSPIVVAVHSVVISGTVFFQGYAPQGAYIAITVRKQGKSGFADVVSGITPDTDGTTEWTWKDADLGVNYEIKATLKMSGKVIESSPVQDVSAPATAVDLALVSELTPPVPETASLSGQINVDGYIPTGATLQVLAEELGSTTFQQIVNNISPTDNVNWSWGSGISGKQYLVKAILLDANGNPISNGDVQTVIAPAKSLVLNVYSTAKPASSTVSGISGTITINGNISSGSYITLATRPTGTTTFNQVASNISASSGVGFSWSGANSGQQYDVQAYLWSNNKPYAQSNILTVTAPSTFDVLTINAQQALQQPSSNTISVNCGTQQNGNFQVTINYNTLGNLASAKSFNIVVTLASQNSQTINTTVSPSNPTTSQNLTTTYSFLPGVTYYAQYAYSTDGNSYSPLSPSVEFACR